MIINYVIAYKSILYVQIIHVIDDSRMHFGIAFIAMAFMHVKGSFDILVDQQLIVSVSSVTQGGHWLAHVIPA